MFGTDLFFLEIKTDHRNRSSTVSMATQLVTILGVVLISICGGQDDTVSREMKQFRQCLDENNYTEDMTNYQLCLNDKEPQMNELCTTLGKDYTSSPLCFDEIQKLLPSTCQSTDYGEKAIDELRTNILIMQLNYCQETFQVGQDRLVRILLQQQGYDYLLKHQGKD